MQENIENKTKKCEKIPKNRAQNCCPNYVKKLNIGSCLNTEISAKIKLKFRQNAIKNWNLKKKINFGKTSKLCEKLKYKLQNMHILL